MTGNKSHELDERWRLLRLLYEQQYLKLDEIALVASIGIDQLVQRSCDELWNIIPKTYRARRNQDSVVPRKSVDLRVANAKTAKQVSTFLKRALKVETKKQTDQEEHTDIQSKTKNVLAIAKGVLTIEEMIANLEKLTNAASLYPQDALEFHSKLEKQIANLANDQKAAAVS